MIVELKNVLSRAEATAATLSGAAGQVTNAITTVNNAVSASETAGTSKNNGIVPQDALGIDVLDKRAYGSRHMSQFPEYS